MTIDTDEAFLERLREGDTDAFAEMYEAYRPNIRHYIWSRVRDQSEVEDLTQETFVEAFRSIRRFEGRSSLLTWLFGIARIVCLRALRFSSRWMVGAQSVDYEYEQAFDARTEARVDAALALDRCEKILNEWPNGRDPWLFHMRYGERLKSREIAARAGISIDAVKTSLRRMRQRLEMRIPAISAAY